ncbi:MAG: uracil-DNA glycosylase [Alcaligenaceae bacterium]|nr:uracil-DNA glycosylase [Alcaligenaceae bacterium]
MIANNLNPPVPVQPRLNPLQVLWLQELEIDQLWGAPFVSAKLGKTGQSHAVSGQAPDTAAVSAQTSSQAFRPSTSSTASLPEQAALQRTAKPVRPVTPVTPKPEEAKPVVPVRPELANLDWAGLRDSAANCMSCDLGSYRKQAVFGEGDVQADWMFIEEAPGEQDDWHGQPFRGKAGELFSNILKAIGLSREQVFIAPLIKCRPIANKAPSKEEIASCADFIQEQIARVQPKCIVVFGRAANTLLGSNEPTDVLRGKTHSITAKNGVQIPVVVTYHPNHLMVMQSDKAKAWQDLQRAQQLMNS